MKTFKFVFAGVDIYLKETISKADIVNNNRKIEKK